MNISVNKLAFALCLVLLTNHLYAGGYSEKEEFQADSQRLIKTLATSLKHELMTALKTGDLSSAVNTCHISAPTITEQLNTDTTSIKRTSLKWRNPDNAPDAWERASLAKFAQQLDNGVAIERLRTTEVIKNERQTTYRYLQAIQTQQVCLVCHGDKDNLSDQVKQVLAEKYPGDLATGYSAGELRGAFSVTRTIAN
jgi:hypothetical protein